MQTTSSPSISCARARREKSQRCAIAASAREIGLCERKQVASWLRNAGDRLLSTGLRECGLSRMRHLTSFATMILHERSTMAKKKIDPLNRKQYSAVSAALTVSNIPAAVSFYQKAFGFAKRGIMNGPDGKPIHAELN